MRENKNTLIDFYKGADGPAIIINIQKMEWLKWFRDSIAQLTDVQPINLIDRNVIKGEGISQLTVVKGN